MDQVIAKPEQAPAVVEQPAERIIELPCETLDRIGGGVVAFTL